MKINSFSSSEQYFHNILEALPIGIYITDALGRITYFNQAAARLWGREPELGCDQWSGAYKLYTIEGSYLPHEDCPMGIALKENRAVRGIKTIGERPDGSRFTYMPYATPLTDDTGKVQGGINIVVEVQDPLAAAANDLAKQVEALARLHELSGALVESGGFSANLQKILDTLVALHDARFGLISLYDPATGKLYQGASHGFSQESMETLASIVPGPYAGGWGTCFWSKSRVIIEDTEADLRFQDYREAARKAGFRAVHSTPVFSKGGAIAGVISVQMETPRRPHRREVQAADMCARYVAQVLRYAPQDCGRGQAA